MIYPPGQFVICQGGGWADAYGMMDDDSAPRGGKVYTVSGTVDLEAGAYLVLAEFPHEAWEVDGFRPVSVLDTCRFGLMMLTTVEITEPDTYIGGKIV